MSLLYTYESSIEAKYFGEAQYFSEEELISLFLEKIRVLNPREIHTEGNRVSFFSDKSLINISYKTDLFFQIKGNIIAVRYVFHTFELVRSSIILGLFALFLSLLLRQSAFLLILLLVFLFFIINFVHINTAIRKSLLSLPFFAPEVSQVLENQDQNKDLDILYSSLSYCEHCLAALPADSAKCKKCKKKKKIFKRKVSIDISKFENRKIYYHLNEKANAKKTYVIKTPEMPD